MLFQVRLPAAAVSMYHGLRRESNRDAWYHEVSPVAGCEDNTSPVT